MKKQGNKNKTNFFKKIFIKICRKLGYEIIDQNNFLVPTQNKNLNENLSIRFRKKPDWISISPSSGQIEGGLSETLIVQVDATGFEDDFQLPHAVDVPAPAPLSQIISPLIRNPMSDMVSMINL